jgi:pyrrolysine biosynthesis protein PylC
VVGGGLQGVEILYLGHKAGWDMTLCDREVAPPALGQAESFINLDLESLSLSDLSNLANNYDLIFPALENKKILSILALASEKDILPPLAFDPKAYQISSSKILSKKLFAKFNTPMAKDYKKGKPISFPLVAKPTGGSGSQGVKILSSLDEFIDYFPTESSINGFVIEEFIEGPSYSIEVVSVKGQSRSFQVTKLEMDKLYDCQKVLAPSDLSDDLEKELKLEIEKLAKAMSLTGIMDFEVILGRDGFKALEIDARFPSQTPTAVYWSTGVNLAVETASCFLDIDKNNFLTNNQGGNSVRYEHIFCVDGQISIHGEHLMSRMGPMVLKKNFRDATEALVSGDPNGRFWAATMIYVC